MWRGVAHFDHIKLTVKILIQKRQPSIHKPSVLRKVVQLYTMMYAHRYQSAFFFAKISHLSLSAAVRYYLALTCSDIQVNGKGKGFRL